MLGAALFYAIIPYGQYMIMTPLEINVYLYATLLIYSPSPHTFSYQITPLLSEIYPNSFLYPIPLRMVSSKQQVDNKYWTLAPWVEDKQK